LSSGEGRLPTGENDHEGIQQELRKYKARVIMFNQP
jgi:hypothetical protein